MFYNTQDLENIISRAYALLKDNKNVEAEQLLKDAHDNINRYYEFKYPMKQPRKIAEK